MPTKITKTTTFRKKTTRRVVRRPKESFAKRVKAVLSKAAEHKMISYDSGLQVFNSGINAATDAIQVMPLMTQGTDDGDRVGNEITCKSFNIRGHYILSLLNNTLSASCRIGVRLMVVEPKRYRNYFDTVANFANYMPSLIRYGDAVRAFTGVISDLYLPLNREMVTVLYDKTVYITMPYMVTAVGEEVITNSVRLFNIHLRCKNKKLRYEDSLANYPQNWSPTMLIGYAKMDGTAPDVAYSGISLQNITTMNFTDV